MKSLIIILCLLLAFTFPSGDGNLITWNEGISLTWNNFNGEPDMKHPGDALAQGKIDYDVAYENGTFTFSVTALFNPNISWVKKGMQTPYLLKHEQLHFDMIEAIARKIRKEFSTYEFTAENFNQEIEDIYYKLDQRCRKMQTRYDNETNNSLNKEEQVRWDKKIKGQLLGDKAYAKIKYTRKLEF